MFYRRRFNKNGLFILIPFLAYGIFYLYQQYSIHHHLDNDGVEMTGYVVSTEEKYLKRGLVVTQIQYRFEVDGVTYYDKVIAHTESTHKLIPRRPIPVRYVPDDPTISEIVGNETSINWPMVALLVLTILAAVLVGIGVMVVSGVIRRLWRGRIGYSGRTFFLNT